MIKLIKIELKKAFPSRTFWILAGLYLLVVGTVLLGVQSFLDNVLSKAGSKSPIPIPEIGVYEFPVIWHNLTFLAGFFKIVLGVIVIIMITNEFSYKTIRQNIIAGFSRLDFLKSKVGLILVLSLYAALVVFLTGTILGFIYTQELTISSFFNKSVFIAAFALEVFSYLCFAFMIGFLVKRSGIAIGLLLLYSFVIEPIINYKLPTEVADFMPLRSINNLIDIPNTALMRLFGVEFQDYISVYDVLLVIAYTIIFLGITYYVLRRRDL
ncbi:MAG: ABC transporter permease [Bacteroidetes bacterium]|nr:ABC transporter permease [Bacteroidota bacterium]